MGDRTAIAWVRGEDGSAGSTWNPIGGTKANWLCRKVSPGCEPCYASELNRKYSGLPFAEIGADLLDTPRFKDHILREVFRWKEPRRVFAGSMTDLWGEWVPYDWQARIYKAALDNPRHTYIWLTKRPELMAQSIRRAQNEGLLPDTLPANWWMGATVEHARFLWRTNHLREVRAQVRWLSLEPLYLDKPWPVDDPRQYDGIHWHVVGGVSGTTPYARERYLVQPTRGEDGRTHWTPGESRTGWIRAMRDAAHEHGIVWFFKQWGGPKPESGGHLLDEREWYEFPIPEPAQEAASASR